ncbi:hypothetical protein MACH17_22650 [Phaeobacter inhibens]|nr:hypothetical protein MACH17_22650 [Phaeobacter inhibens]
MAILAPSPAWRMAFFDQIGQKLHDKTAVGMDGGDVGDPTGQTLSRILCLWTCRVFVPPQVLV